MIPIRCRNCGLLVQVPPGGRRLCGCGSWLSAADADREGGAGREPDEAAIERLMAGCRRLLGECGKVVIGQTEVLEQIVLALISRGHCLLVRVPGLAKTLMVRT